MRHLLDTFAHARATLNQDLTSPSVRRPRLLALHQMPDGMWRWVALPVKSRAAQVALARRGAVNRRLGMGR